MATRGERREPKPPRLRVDFASVPPSQWQIHDRLTNWARWCRGRQGQFGDAGSPMFELFKSDNWGRAYGEETSLPIDSMDAQRVAKGVYALPYKHRKAIHWCYIKPRDAMRKARELAVSLEGLAELVREARTMLVNRGV